MRRISLFILALAGTFAAEAQVTADTTAAVASDTTKGALSISGYVDAYYTYNLNRPGHQPGFAWENGARIFDIKHNEFSLGLAQVFLQYEKGKGKAVVDLTFGPNAELGNFGNVVFPDGADGWSPSFASIKQAYIEYAFSDKLAMTVGQYGTHIGYELIDAPLNFNYSLSHLFGNGPFYHTGIRFNYAINDQIGVMAGVVNGWDNMFDSNDEKSFTAQIGYAPKENWNIFLNYIGGDESAGSFGYADMIGDTAATVHLFDLTTAYTVGENTTLGLNAAYGIIGSDANQLEGANNWYGAALYLNSYFTDNFGLGFRGEYYNDNNGLRYFSGNTRPIIDPTTNIASGFEGVGVSITSFTLTASFKNNAGNFMFKPEARLDLASDNTFFGDEYISDGAGNLVFTEDSQFTLGTAFIYSF